MSAFYPSSNTQRCFCLVWLLLTSGGGGKQRHGGLIPTELQSGVLSRTVLSCHQVYKSGSVWSKGPPQPCVFQDETQTPGSLTGVACFERRPGKRTKVSEPRSGLATHI